MIRNLPKLEIHIIFNPGRHKTLGDIRKEYDRLCQHHWKTAIKPHAKDALRD